MKRRLFVSGVTASALAAAAPATRTPRRIGMTDVERLQQRFAEVIASDHRHGGQLNIENHAVALADTALKLQESGSATERVRSHLYGCAAAFRSSAMWAAIDGRRFDIAISHMREAQALAEMASDQAIKFRIWSHASTMYRHIGRPTQAMAANNVARSLHLNRRDPMFASLGLARQMAIHGASGDPIGTRRAYDEAQSAMDRADLGAYRPVWLNAFYDQAELDSLALSSYLALRDWEKAEYHAYRCLAALRPHMRRSKAITMRAWPRPARAGRHRRGNGHRALRRDGGRYTTPSRRLDAERVRRPAQRHRAHQHGRNHLVRARPNPWGTAA